jgi:hypothetical protein
MHPVIPINYLAIVAAVAASFVFGFLWHGPLFGKKWASLMGMSMDKKPDMGMMLRPMLLTLFGTLLTSYVLVHTTHIWRASTWGAGADSASYVYGFLSGFFTWLGFYVPVFLSTVAWEGRSWGLFLLNVSYHFINLQIIAMIIAYWR